MHSVRSSFNQKVSGNDRFTFFYTNGYDHEKLPVITQESPNDITWMQWGLVPSFIKGMTMKEDHLTSQNSLHERSERVFTSWLTEELLTTKRCLIPATGFFIWTEVSKKIYDSNKSYSQKYHYHVEMLNIDSDTGTMPFCFPGLYNKWQDRESKEIHEGFIIFTCDAEYGHFMQELTESSNKYSGRMPCILPNYQYNEWLNPSLDLDDIESYLYPYDADYMRAYSVTQNLSKFNTNHNIPESVLFHPYTALKDKNKYNFG